MQKPKPESDQYIPQKPTKKAFYSDAGSRLNNLNGSDQELKYMYAARVTSEDHTGEVGQSDENKSSNEISAGKLASPRVDQNAGQRKKYVRKNVTCFDKDLVSVSQISLSKFSDQILTIYRILSYLRWSKS